MPVVERLVWGLSTALLIRSSRKILRDESAQDDRFGNRFGILINSDSYEAIESARPHNRSKLTNIPRVVR